MSKGSLMQKAQTEKTKQTLEQLVQWYSSKEDFFKTYLPIQQTIVKRVFSTVELTVTRLKEISLIVKEEREVQEVVYEKIHKNTLSNQALFHPLSEEISDQKGSKIKSQMPAWSSNIDRIFISLSQHQQSKLNQIKTTLKTLEQIEQSLRKEESRYKAEIKKAEKDVEALFAKLDNTEQEASKIMGKLVKQNKSQPLKQADFFINELKKLEMIVLKELELFAERGKRLSEFLEVIVKMEKEVAKKIKEEMTNFLNYRKNFLGIDTKQQEDIWGKVSLCQQKIEIQRVSYFNKMLYNAGQIQVLRKLMPDFEPKNNWQVIVKFLNTSTESYSAATKTQKSMFYFLKNISYRCWTSIYLAQGWLIQSYTPSIMYMTYDHIMVIYSMEGAFLKRISTISSKISKFQGNTLFLQQKVKGFFSDSIQEYKIRFQDTERMEEFQLFMENQIK